MSDTFVVEAELRSDEGKGASRRLRRLEAGLCLLCDPHALVLFFGLRSCQGWNRALALFFKLGRVSFEWIIS